MSSFYAELEVDGHTYPIRSCQFEFTQATGERGRVVAKVRHGLLQLTLDVPDDDRLLNWATTAYKPLAGHVTFFETHRLTAREAVGFAAGHCVSYHETFASGDAGAGAYVCQLTIAADKLALLSGGPGRALVPAAAKDYVTAASALAHAPYEVGYATVWLDDLEATLGPAVDVRALVTRWIAGGLSESKLRSALRGTVDKRLVFERLLNADKGIYQQRVVIDDYINIPGLSKRPYNRGNSLSNCVQLG